MNAGLNYYFIYIENFVMGSNKIVNRQYFYIINNVVTSQGNDDVTLQFKEI